MNDSVRWFLLATFLVGTAGTSVELALLGHIEDLWQVVPLLLAGLAVGILIVLISRPSREWLLALRVVLVAMIASGVLGAYLHLRANMEFQLETDPTLSGLALLGKAVRAKSPPALAPGAMIQLGLIGLAYTMRHPALGRRTTTGTLGAPASGRERE